MIKHSDMELLQRRIADGDPSLADADIADTFLAWLPSYNCETAAKGYLWFVSSVANYKSQLVEPLLKKAIEPVYYLDYESSEGVIHWAARFAESPDGFYKPSESGKVWLVQQLPGYKEFIEECLKDYIAE